MLTTHRILLAVFMVTVVAIMLNCCNYNKSNTPYHDFLQSEEFKTLNRKEQITKCASCHKEQVENESKGPHGNAYQQLVAHRDFVNSDKYSCGFYTRSVNRSFNDCMGCHAPKNLFETSLKDTLNNPDKFIAGLLQISHPRPESRTGEGSRVTSIDCFSCHYDGKGMVSLKHVSSKDDSIPALQTLTTITKNNISCFTCHADVVKQIKPKIAIARTGSVLCVNCHQEYSSGKGTHYYYWSHDPKEKVNSKMYWLMDDFRFKLSGKGGEITWNNTSIPHRISPGPEMILNCDVLDKDSNLLGHKTIRINKKKEFDAEMYSNMENNTHLGEYGNDVPLDGSEIKYSVLLKNATKAKLFRISLIHKAQYWFPDSLGQLTAVKTYPILP